MSGLKCSVQTWSDEKGDHRWCKMKASEEEGLARVLKRIGFDGGDDAKGSGT